MITGPFKRITPAIATRVGVERVQVQVQAPVKRPASTSLGAPAKGDFFKAVEPGKVKVSDLGEGVKELAALTDGSKAYSFPRNFLGTYSALLKKAGLPASEKNANLMLNTLLLREDKPHTAAFVRTVMESPAALDTAVSNMSKYIENPTNTILPKSIAANDVGVAFDRVAFLPFLGSDAMVSGLTQAMAKDLALGGAQLAAAAKAGISTDVTVVGQGPTGAMLARTLSNALPEGARAAVVGGETTFSAGDQWFLNSPNRQVTGSEDLGPGGPLNPIDDRLGDADLSGRYYARAGVIDNMTKVSLHASGLPVLTDNITSIEKGPKGYVLRTAEGRELPTSVVALASGLGDKPKPLATTTGTRFVEKQYAQMTKALQKAKAGDASGLREFPQWASTLDFFRAQKLMNDPLAMLASGESFKNVKEAISGAPKQAAEEYLARAFYKAKKPVGEIENKFKGQKVVGVVGLGDSARTALEALTGLGPDTRSPRQLGVVPKAVWFVGENGPADCAEFYTGDLIKGFDGFSTALRDAGGPNLADIFRARIESKASSYNPQTAVRAYLNEFSQLLTTQKPKQYFDELLKNSGLSEEAKREAFGVFLKEREAVRPRYNQLVIPIEKGQIELVTQRVEDAELAPRLGNRVLVTGSNGKTKSTFIVDQVLDARGNVNDSGKVVSGLVDGATDAFTNPALHDRVVVVDGDGNEVEVAKRLKGHDVYLVGPASDVVSKANNTNVGANKVSIFLNRPLNELTGEALANEIALRLAAGKLGSPKQREAQLQELTSVVGELRAQSQIRDVTLGDRAEKTVTLGEQDRFLRSSLEANPLSAQAGLNELLERIQFAPSVRAGDRLSVRLTPAADGKVTIDAPSSLLKPLTEWAKTREGADFLRTAVGTGRPVGIERSVGSNGKLAPIETWI